MKNTNYLFLIAILSICYLISSCSKDDNNPGNQGDDQLANDQNATEEAAIPTSTIETGFNIGGATKETGTPPSPNSNLNFNLNTDLTEAFQDTGLRIEFSSTESIIGAYILFKDVDGNPASEYYDVSSTYFSNTNARVEQKATPMKINFSNARVAEDFDNEIVVNFDSSVPAGQFCYDICIYDVSYNISQIKTVCVTVEAWGGNSSIVGEWVFDREEPADEFDLQVTITCENGQTIEVDYAQYTTDEWTFVLNDDGTYYEIYEEGVSELDYFATESNCSATYGETESEKGKYSGNWAYNEENQTLTVVDFKYEDLLDATITNEYEVGEVYFEGVQAEVVSGQLVLSETDGTETYKIFFNRK